MIYLVILHKHETGFFFYNTAKTVLMQQPGQGP